MPSFVSIGGRVHSYVVIVEVIIAEGIVVMLLFMMMW